SSGAGDLHSERVKVRHVAEALRLERRMRPMSTRPVSAPANVHIRRYQLSDVSDVFEAVRESLTELQAGVSWSQPAYSIHESRSWLQAQIAAFDQRTAFEFAM